MSSMTETPANTSIRPATPDDASAVRAVGRASWHAAYDDLLGSERVDETIDEWWDLPGLRRATGRDDDVFLVAVTPEAANGAVAGVAHAHPDRGEAGVYELGRIYVHPDWWGEGLGTALLDGVRQRLPDATERLRLVVLADNDVGVSFYESYGFERVESRVAGLGDDHEECVYEVTL